MTKLTELAQATAETIDAVRVVILPIDIVQLVTGSLSGLAALMSAFAAAYAIISSVRAGRAEKIAVEVQADIGIIKNDVGKLETATNSLVAKAEAAARAAGIKEATAAGEAKAATLAQGQEEGRGHRGRTKASDEPLPVEDEAAAKIAERGVEAMEKGAKAQEKIAEAGEKKT